MNWSSWESASLPQANFKMGRFRNSEAGRLNCYSFKEKIWKEGVKK
ncbi:hypothetical protein [Sporofaciens musculi]|nr:hypothetical protein [Sporofaciens musculi]